MKKLIIPVGMLLLSGFYHGQTTSPSSGENYIYSKIILDYDINNQVSKTSESVQYLDGLGRAKQVVNVKASPSGKDLVTTIPYDGFGRAVDSWLPVPMATLNGGIQSGVNTAGTSYYGDSRPFGHKDIENSPLDRIFSQVQPGLDWQGHSVQFGYDTNDGNEVYKFVTTTTFPNGATTSVLKTSANSDNSLSGLYKANKLYKNTVTDEDGNQTIEFKNGEGQVLLVRKVLSATDYADTYYVYNEYNLLAFVIPPKAVGLLKDSGLAEETIVDNPILGELCYQYRYDARRRLVEKKLPGKEWEYMVYDKQDRLVMTQDANMGASRQWLFTKYDQYGRVSYTGIYTSAQNYGSPGRSLEQVNVNSKGSNNVSRSTMVGFTESGMGVYYDNGSGSYPNTITKLLSVNYYDTYPSYSFNPAFPSNILGEPTLTDVSSESRSTKSLPVLSLIKNIEDDNWTKGYTYYDRKGRPLGSYSINHLGGRTQVYTRLNFSGGVQQSITTHKRLDIDTDKIITENFTYDSQNRLTSHTHQVNSGPVEYLTQNKYNDLLQLESKKVGGTVLGSGLQQVDYQYNIRGWMTRINDPGNLGSDLFGYAMKYTNPVYSGVSPGKFNGNISEIDWKASTDSNLKRYNYQYDVLNRLTGGIYSEPDTTVPQNNYYNETMSYDLNGNITTLQRNRFISNAGLQQMDNLAYGYDIGNRLNTITDTTLNFGGYPEVSGNLIHYDQNGNMTDHIDKGVLGISYNHLNLVSSVKFDRTYVPRYLGGNNMNVNTKYLYRADGVKLRKIYTYGSGRTSLETSTITEYLDGFQYEKEDMGGRQTLTSEPNFVPTAEGYYNFENNKYIYHYTDHLGNIRISYMDNGSGAAVIEEDNYYPFGLKHGTGDSTGNSLYRYQYNGKEYQTETGWNDYGARMYMPDLGRWGVADPLAEKSRRFSPYNYAVNNPVMFIDPDGREAEHVDPTEIYRKGNQQQIKAFENFARSKEGKSLIAKFAQKGQVIAGVKYNKNGEFHNKKMDLTFDNNVSKQSLSQNASGETTVENKNGRTNFTVSVANNNTPNRLVTQIETFAHEGFVHVLPEANDFFDDSKFNQSSGYDKRLINYLKQPQNAQFQSVRIYDHYQEKNNHTARNQYIRPILQQYYQSINKNVTNEQLNKSIDDFSY